jgi:methionyl-tRNA formyltransferase
MKSRVILIAALENGRIAARYFLKLHEEEKIELLKVYTYEDDIVPNKDMFAKFDDIIPSNILKKVAHINRCVCEIRELDPDFTFVVGWSQLLSKDIIKASKKGVIGFHTSKLPKDRGRSTLAWQIVEGYKETALTMFYLDEGIDNGDIIAQEMIKINSTDYISDVLSKVNKATYNLLSTYFPLLITDKAPRIRQQEELATYRRLRTDEDSCINWNDTAENIYNLIRAVAFPYPKAWTLYRGETIKINKATIVNFLPSTLYIFEEPGVVLGNIKGFEYLVKTKDGIIAIKEIEPRGIFIPPGERLGK